jgi:hypothetical protein
MAVEILQAVPGAFALSGYIVNVGVVGRFFFQHWVF